MLRRRFVQLLASLPLVGIRLPHAERVSDQAIFDYHVDIWRLRGDVPAHRRLIVSKIRIRRMSDQGYQHWRAYTEGPFPVTGPCYLTSRITGNGWLYCHSPTCVFMPWDQAVRVAKRLARHYNTTAQYEIYDVAKRTYTEAPV